MRFKKLLLKLLQSPDYKPLKKEEIANSLEINGKERLELFSNIALLIQKKQISLNEDKKIKLVVARKKEDYIRGTLKFKQNGSALFFPENNEQINPYYVSKQDTHIALHGDTVVGRVIKKQKHHINPKYKGKSNSKIKVSSLENQIPFRVLKVIERAQENYIGTYTSLSETKGSIIADDPRIIPEFIVSKSPLKGQKIKVLDGEKVNFKIINWSQRVLMPEAEILDILGKTHEPKAEFKAILIKYNLDPEFPIPVIKEADNFPTKVIQNDLKNRIDLRKEFTFTIDPDDAKDFDDALSVKKIESGLTEVSIHIADVSSYIKSKSALDIEAKNRGNSTYLVGTVIPMLPYSISNGLCSLVEGEDRLTKSVIIQFNNQAEIQKVTFANSVIRSNKRLTYRQALAFLEKKDINLIKKTPLPPKHQTGSIGRPLDKLKDEELIQLKYLIGELWSIASKLRERRFQKGSLDLDMNELKIYVDPNGYAQRLEKQVNDNSHQLIEEFMLVANEQVAKLFKREQIASIYRVHDKPEEGKLLELRQFMQTYGIPCNQLSKPIEMARLLKKLKEHPQSYALKLQVLKSLKQAQYRPDPNGHYGLAKMDYTHFTSPIRRYSDLIVHRILDNYLYKSKSKSAPYQIDINYNQSTLESITQHLNITERNSVDAERESTKVKLLEYFEKELEIIPPNMYDAVITDVKNHGLFIELVESQAFGFVHISKLGDDHHYLRKNDQTIIGKVNGETFSIGDKIKVSVLKVDRFKRQIDFKLTTSINKTHPKSNFKNRKNHSLDSSPKALNKLRKLRRSRRRK